jgi:3-phenylpropionate/trans-cinnamate dioxygenase ferredoxin subunit
VGCVASPTVTKWVKIAEIGDVHPGAGRAFEVEGNSIAVFNVDGKLYAIDDSCPHQGSSLAMGSLDGCVVTCRSHGMKVNVTAGELQPGLGMNVRSFPVESRPDGLYVGLQTSP